MSQQKFASNVIEKCLAFGNPVERQVLIGEMLGSSNESEHLEVCVCFNLWAYFVISMRYSFATSLLLRKLST
jgi:hypothetical protein